MTRRTNGRDRTQTAGFTLVEVLVVIVIMSGILVTISTVLATARDTRDAIHNLNETQLAGPAILDLVESDLRGLLTYSMRPSKVLRVTSKELNGDPADRIDFVTTTNSKLFELAETRVLRSDYNEIGYVLRERPDSREFLEIYRREGFGVDEDPFEGGKYTFLHDRVTSFEILVYDEDGPDAEPLEEWNTGTEPENRLPLRIEIKLELEIAPRLLDPKKALEMTEQPRAVEYRRVFRIGAAAHLAFETEPVAKIPDVRPPSDRDTSGGLADPLSGAAGGNPLEGGGFGDPFNSGGSGGNPFEGIMNGQSVELPGGGSITDIFGGGGGGGGGG